MAQSRLVSAPLTPSVILVLSLSIALPLVASAAASTGTTTRGDGPVPSRSLDPAEVVRIQVEALRTNSPLNEGIALTYRFASPGNKSHTGPLERFTEMVRTAPYDRLLNHLSASYGPVAVSGLEAYLTVVVIDKSGQEVAYVWVLSSQSEGDFEDCWMTDAVIPAEGPTQRKLI